jgi:hypothetical protein
MRYSIYILDFNWNYLFLNDFVIDNLKTRDQQLIGENMWATFPALAADPDYMRMKQKIEENKMVTLVTHSPLTGQRLSIVGYTLEDCYFFSSHLMPNKQDLLNDLRSQLEKN